MKRFPISKTSLLTSAIALLPSFALALPAQAATPEGEAISPTLEPSSIGNTLETELSTEEVDTFVAATDDKLAATPSKPIATNNELNDNALKIDSTSQLRLAQRFSDENDLGQVTSVSQLSDVQPTDWAYQAVRSLVERYGCLAGYPNGTFRGNRAATRYELAAALNACLDQISDRLASQEDLATVQGLQTELKAELETLRGRIDGLEARADQIEANQFSTTSKLSGLAVFQAQFGDISRNGFINPETNAVVNSGDTRPSTIAVSILDFNTSFTGSDLLQTSLAAGNNGQDAAVGLGLTNYPQASGNANQPFFVARGTSALSQYPANFFLFRLAYTFKPVEDLSITVGPQLYPNDFLDFNTYANNPFTDFNSYFFTNNPLIIPFALNFFGGAGGGLNWNVNGGPVNVRATYVAANAGTATATPNGGGLFGDPYQASAEVEYADSFGSDDQNNFAVRLQYTNSATFDVDQNAVGLNAEVTLGRLGLFGRYGYSDASASGTATAPLAQQNFTAHTWMAGVGYKDLIKPGSLLAASVGQPFINNLPATVSFGPNNATQTNYEAFFRMPVGDNITLTPGISVITDANNINGQPTLFQGYLRTTFFF